MLGPFRIRNLKPYHQTALPNTERLSACEAVVSLTGNEYQKNIDTHPDSRLKYIDEDDGETVTVGSSTELASRLQDVVPQRTRRVSASYHKSFGKMPSEPGRPPSPKMHVFEIDRTNDSVRIWQDIEQRCKDMTLELDHFKPHYSEQTDNDMEVHCDPADDAARLQEMREDNSSPMPFKAWSDHRKSLDEKARSLHFATSNPPQIPTRHKTKASEEDSLARYHKWGNSMMDQVSLALPKAPVTAPPLPQALPFSSGISGDGKLTAEGQRQAIEAGSLLRMRNNQTWYPPTLPLSGPKPSNRWASYATSNTSMVPNNVSDKSSEPTNTSFVASSTRPPPNVEHSTPLLHMFREELAKIRKPMEKFKVDHAWKTACEDASKTPALLGSKSAAQPKQESATAFNNELLEIVDDLMCGVYTLVNETQVRFTRLASNTERNIEPKNGSINHEVLSVILQDFRAVTQKALIECRKAIPGVARSTGQQMDITTCQVLVKSLQELSKGIDTFVTLLSATALVPQTPLCTPQKSEFPNEPLKIEIGNIPDSASQDQIRSLILRALSIDGPFSGKPSDILSIRIVAATAEKSSLAQVRFRSHQVAVHVITHLKGSQFGGKTLSATVLRELNRRDKAKGKEAEDEHPTDTKPLTSTSNELLDQRPELTGEVPFSAMPKFQATAPNEARTLARPEENVDVPESTTMRPRGPIVRFADLPTLQGKRTLSVTAVPGAVNVPHIDPTISFRHVPSPMPGAAIGKRRSLQFTRFPSFKSQRDASSYTDEVPRYAPSPYKQYPKPSRTEHVATASESQVKSGKDQVEVQDAAKVEDEKLEYNPWLADVARSRENLQQPSKTQSDSQVEPKDAEKKDVASKLPGSDAWPEPHHGRSFVYVPSRIRDHPGAWEGMTDEHANGFRSTAVHQDTDSSSRKPVSCHYSQSRIPQAPPGGWTPSNIKEYHGRNANGLNWDGTALMSASLATSTMGHSGRGYPEVSNAKNLRHSVSTEPIHKADPTLFGDSGLPTRSDVGRRHPFDQMCRPKPVFVPPESASSTANEEERSFAESTRLTGQAAPISSTNEVDYLTGNTDIVEPLAPSLPVLEQTQFPTLEQFGQRETATENATSIANVTPGFPALISEQRVEQKLANDVTVDRAYGMPDLSSPNNEPSKARILAAEDVATVVMPGFPPLPGMEPLTPDLPKTSNQDSSERKEQRKISRNIITEESFCAPLYDAFGGHNNSNGAPQSETPSDNLSFRNVFQSPVSAIASSSGQKAPINESSGAFFKRMTGIDSSSSQVFDTPEKPVDAKLEDLFSLPDGTRPTLESSTLPLGPRLVRPFDPLAETAAIHRHRLIESVARSNTIAGHGDYSRARIRRPYSEYLPRVDDDPQRGSFAELTRPLRSNLKDLYRRQSKSELEKPKDDETSSQPRMKKPEVAKIEWEEKTPQSKMKKFKETRVDMAKPNEVKWGIEWEEKKEAQAEYALRRKSMQNLDTSWKKSERAASPFMDPRPAPSLPGTASASATSLPPHVKGPALLSVTTIPGSFPPPTFPDAAPVPRPFSFVDSASTVVPKSNDTSSVRVTVSAAPRAPRELSKVDRCVEQLRNLGYSQEEDGGVERLKIYAQDAGGDVWDAVEMIEGERRVLGERGLAIE